MARFLVLLNIGMFVGYAFGYIADRVGKKSPDPVAGLRPAAAVHVQATDHLLLLWLGPVFAFFMAFAGLMGSCFAELFHPAAPRARALLQRGTRHLRLRAAAAGLDVRHLRLRPEHRRLRRRCS